MRCELLRYSSAFTISLAFPTFDLLTPRTLDFGGNVALGQCQVAKLTASDASAGGSFAESVSIAQNSILIGASEVDGADPSDPGCNSGSAYLYRREGSEWIQKKTLVASNASCGNLFGRAVAIDHDLAVVSALPGNVSETIRGSAYVFHFRDGDWFEQAKLTASDGRPWDAFGLAVSAHGQRVAIGAHNVGNTGPWAGDGFGAVYVYEFDGVQWKEQAKLVASDPKPGAWFGWSVSLDEDVIVIGAPNDGDLSAGAAYIFRFNGASWAEEDKLTGPSPTWFGEFGGAVSIRKDTIVIGNDRDDDRDPDYIACDSGSASIYRFDGSSWDQETKLVDPDAYCAAQFGHKVAVANDTAVVAEITDGHPGAVFVYQRDGGAWTKQHNLTVAPMPWWFGRAVSVDAETVVVGAECDLGAQSCSGSAFVFSMSNCVSLREFAELQSCCSSTGAIRTGCENWDSDSDGDVDLSDYSSFLGKLGARCLRPTVYCLRRAASATVAAEATAARAA